ncbi:hypothetical protein ACLQ2P_26120 [Actinomadura citrea]|uniref:hypothetical protein n=1 Tax=Actinomadura citrea TaxID=46158 RepID=UPI003CE5B49D
MLLETGSRAWAGAVFGLVADRDWECLPVLYLLASDMPVLADRSLDHTAFLEKIEISARGH